MTNQEKEIQESIFSIENFDDFVAGNGGSSFLIEDGAYDAICVGHRTVRAEFDGKITNRLQLLWQLADEEGTVHNIRGNEWTVSASENSKMRQELQAWFNTSDWGTVADLLIKGSILIKDEETGRGQFNPDGFIGKKSRLLIATKKSKKGKSFNVVSSMAPFKKKSLNIEYIEIPEFYITDEKVLDYKLMKGIGISKKKDEDKDGTPETFDGPNEKTQEKVGASNKTLAKKEAPVNPNIDALPEPEPDFELPF